MADNNLPKQDFAPPWLKFPQADAAVRIFFFFLLTALIINPIHGNAESPVERCGRHQHSTLQIGLVR